MVMFGVRRGARHSTPRPLFPARTAAIVFSTSAGSRPRSRATFPVGQHVLQPTPVQALLDRLRDQLVERDARGVRLLPHPREQGGGHRGVQVLPGARLAFSLADIPSRPVRHTLDYSPRGARAIACAGAGCTHGPCGP